MNVEWHEFHVAATGTQASMVVEDLPWATVRLTDDVEIQSELLDPDEMQHSMTWHGLELVVRHTVSQWWTIRWMLHNPTSEVIEVPDLCVRFEVGPESCGWAWASGANGTVIAAPVYAQGPVVAWSVTLGCLRRSGKKLIVTPPGLVLRPGQRYVSSWRGKRYLDVSSARAALPKWLPEIELEASEPLVIEKPSAQVIADDSVRVLPFDEDGVPAGVLVHGPVGESNIGVLTGRGETRMKPCWAPEFDALLYRAGEVLLRENRKPTGAEGLVLLAGVSRNLFAEPELAWARLDVVSAAQGDDYWGQLDVAFGAMRALATGDSVLAGVALRHCLQLTVGLGYGQVAARLWIAATALGLDASPLLERSEGTRPGLTELALVTNGSAAENLDLWAGTINRLGADLPGRPWALGRVRRAKMVGVLRMCPDSVPFAELAAKTVTKTERRLLAMIADGDLQQKDVETLAWLALARG